MADLRGEKAKNGRALPEPRQLRSISKFDFGRDRSQVGLGRDA